MPDTSTDDLPLFAHAKERRETPAREHVGRVAWVPYTDTETSLDAAAAAVPRALTDEQRVLEALRQRADTDEGLGDRLSLPGNSIRPRRGSLVKKGLVEDSGERRETRSGRKAKVWRVIDGGP